MPRTSFEDRQAWLNEQPDTLVWAVDAILRELAPKTGLLILDWARMLDVTLLTSDQLRRGLERMHEGGLLVWDSDACAVFLYGHQLAHPVEARGLGTLDAHLMHCNFPAGPALDAWLIEYDLMVQLQRNTAKGVGLSLVRGGC